MQVRSTTWSSYLTNKNIIYVCFVYCDGMGDLGHLIDIASPAVLQVRSPYPINNETNACHPVYIIGCLNDKKIIERVIADLRDSGIISASEDNACVFPSQSSYPTSPSANVHIVTYDSFPKKTYDFFIMPKVIDYVDELPQTAAEYAYLLVEVQDKYKLYLVAKQSNAIKTFILAKEKAEELKKQLEVDQRNDQILGLSEEQLKIIASYSIVVESYDDRLNDFYQHVATYFAQNPVLREQIANAFDIQTISIGANLSILSDVRVPQTYLAEHGFLNEFSAKLMRWGIGIDKNSSGCLLKPLPHWESDKQRAEALASLNKDYLHALINQENIDTAACEEFLKNNLMIPGYLKDNLLTAIFIQGFATAQPANEFKNVVFHVNDLVDLSLFDRDLLIAHGFTEIELCTPNKTETIQLVQNPQNKRSLRILSEFWLSREDHTTLYQISPLFGAACGDKSVEQLFSAGLFPFMQIRNIKIAFSQSLPEFVRTYTNNSDLIKYIESFMPLSKDCLTMQNESIENRKKFIKEKSIEMSKIISDETIKAWAIVVKGLHQNQNFYDVLPHIFLVDMLLYCLPKALEKNNSKDAEELREMLKQLTPKERCAIFENFLHSKKLKNLEAAGYIYFHFKDEIDDFYKDSYNKSREFFGLVFALALFPKNYDDFIFCAKSVIQDEEKIGIKSDVKEDVELYERLRLIPDFVRAIEKFKNYDEKIIENFKTLSHPIRMKVFALALQGKKDEVDQLIQSEKSLQKFLQGDAAMGFLLAAYMAHEHAPHLTAIELESFAEKLLDKYIFQECKWILDGYFGRDPQNAPPVYPAIGKVFCRQDDKLMFASNDLLACAYLLAGCFCKAMQKDPSLVRDQNFLSFARQWYLVTHGIKADRSFVKSGKEEREEAHHLVSDPLISVQSEPDRTQSSIAAPAFTEEKKTAKSLAASSSSAHAGALFSQNTQYPTEDQFSDYPITSLIRKGDWDILNNQLKQYQQDAMKQKLNISEFRRNIAEKIIKTLQRNILSKEDQIEILDRVIKHDFFEHQNPFKRFANSFLSSASHLFTVSISDPHAQNIPLPADSQKLLLQYRDVLIIQQNRMDLL